MAKEGVEIIEARPSDCRHAHGARFVGGKEDEVLCVRLLAKLIKPLQCVDLAMPERILQLVIGLGQHEGQIRLSQYGCSEDLVAQRHAACGQWQDIVFDNIEETRGYGLLGQGMALSICNRFFRHDLDQKVAEKYRILIENSVIYISRGELVASVGFPLKHGLPRNKNLLHYVEGIFVPSTLNSDRRYCDHV